MFSRCENAENDTFTNNTAYKAINPIDLEIKEISAEARYSTKLVQVLQNVKSQYSSLQLDFMKDKIDKIMSNNPIALEHESLKRILENLGQRISSDLNSIKGKSISKPLEIYSLNPSRNINLQTNYQSQNYPMLPLVITPMSNANNNTMYLNAQQITPQNNTLKTRYSFNGLVPATPAQTPIQTAAQTPMSFLVTPTNNPIPAKSNMQNDVTQTYTGLPVNSAITPTNTSDVRIPSINAFQVLSGGASYSPTRYDSYPSVQGVSYPPVSNMVATSATQTTPKTDQGLIITGRPTSTAIANATGSSNPTASFSQVVKQVVDQTSPGGHHFTQSTLSFGGVQTNAPYNRIST